MKTINVLKNSVLVAACVLASLAGFAQDGKAEKKLHQEYKVNASTTVSLHNKFGKVHVTTGSGDQVVIDVEILVSASKQDKADKLLEQINVNFSKGNSLVQAKTEIKESNNSKTSFEINYTVTMPRANPLKIKNQFGDVFVSGLDGSLNLDLQYGNLVAGDLNHSDNELDISFGKADIEKLTKADVNLSYSDFEVEESEELNIDSQFGKLDLGTVITMDFDSQYDKLKLDEVTNLNVDSQFTSLKIGVLHSRLNVDNTYGGVDIEEVKKTFKEIDIDSEFASVSVDIERGASFSVDAETDFCSMNCPGDWNIKAEKEGMNSKSYSGVVGSDATASLKIDSNYGGVKVRWF